MNERNRLWMKSVERNDRITFFILDCFQKELINNALKEQNQRMKMINVSIIRLVSVRIMKIKNMKNINEEEWEEEVMIVVAWQNFKLTENAAKMKNAANWMWREKAKEKEHLLSMKNLRSEEYLSILIMISDEISKDIAMQNIFILKEAIKIKERTESKNIDDKMKFIMWIKRLQNTIKERANIKNLLKIMINQKVQSIFWSQLLKHSFIFFQAFFDWEMLFKAKEAEKSDDVQMMIVKFKDFQMRKLKAMLYAMKCSMQRMLINDEIYIKTLINSKTEINVISETFVSETQLFMQWNYHLKMIEVSKAKAQFMKICENVKIDIKEAKTIILIFMIKDNKYSLILNRSYERWAYLSIKNTSEKICEMKMTDDNDKMISFKLILAENSFNHNIIEIFLERKKDSLNE